MQKHVHPRECKGGVVLLLAIDGDAAWRFVGSFKQQRTGAASGVVNRLVLAGVGINVNHLCHDAGNLGWGVKLPLALARLGGEVTHEVFVGVAE